MAKFIRRGAIIGTAALAGSLAFGAPAVADSDPFIDGSPIADDGALQVTPEQGPAIYRFADKDRIGTAIKAAKQTDRGHWGDTVIIANSQVYADALTASPLADTLDAPVLLSAPGDAVDKRVMKYIQDAGFSNAIVVGGTDVFGDKVVDGLTNAGVRTERIDGPNRYQTAIALAEWAVSQNEGAFENVFIASGKNFPDALAAGAAAANNSGVVLLTQGWDGIDSATYGALSGTGSYDGPMDEIHGSFIAVGGPAASALENGWQGESIEADDEVVGVNRYFTATELATEYFDGTKGETENVTIASGQNFPDGVVAGAYAGNADGPLLLTQEDSLYHGTADYMTDVADRDNIEQVFLFGGTDSVSKSVTNEIAALPWTY